MSVKALFTNQKIKTKEVNIEGFGTVYIKKMSLAGRMKMNKATIQHKDDPTDSQVQAIKDCVCDADGTAVLGDDDEAVILATDAGVVDSIFEEILDFNGFGVDEEKEEAKN